MKERHVWTGLFVILIIMFGIGLINQLGSDPTGAAIGIGAVSEVISSEPEQISSEAIFPSSLNTQDFGIQAEGDSNSTWVLNFADNNLPTGGIAIDSNDNVYLTGIYTDSDDYLDFLVEKIYANGTRDLANWNQSFQGTDELDSETGYGVAVDSNDNIFFIGGIQNLSGFGDNSDWVIKKFNASGTENTTDWNKNITSSSDSGADDVARAIAIDSNNDVYVVGEGTNLIAAGSGNDWWIKKFWENGTEDTVNWNKSYSNNTGTAADKDNAYGVAIDSSDNVFVVGGINISNNAAWNIRKYNASGTENTTDWNLNFTSNGDTFARTVAIDSNDNVYVGGTGRNLVAAASGPDWWLKKFWANGTEDITWNISYSGQNSGNEVINFLAIDGNDNVYAFGDLNTSVGFMNPHIKQYNSLGVEDVTYWNKSFTEGVDIESVSVYGALDSNGNIILTTYNASTDLAVIRKYEGAGPITNLMTPIDEYTNTTLPSETINFSCNVTDPGQLANISLYLTNSTNSSLSLNQTASVSGNNATASWNVALGVGNYTWNCLSSDADGNTDWGVNRTITKTFGCGVSLSNSVTLIADLSATGTCFNLTASNIVIDGAGYTLTGNGSGIGIDDFSLGYENITVKNFAGINNFTNGVSFEDGFHRNITIINNTFTSAVAGGDNYYVRLGSSNNSNIQGNTFIGISTNEDSEVLGVTGDAFNVRVFNNTFNLSADNAGISAESDLGNNITSNTFISSSSSAAITLVPATVNNVSYITSNVFTLIGSGIGILVIGRVVVDSNNMTVSGTSGRGITYLDNSINSTYKNNNILVNFSNATGIANTYLGFFLYPTGNVLLNNNITVLLGQSISDFSNSTDATTLVYNNTFGEISWGLVNLTSNISLDIGSTVFLENNTIGLIDDSESLNLNGTATIKFFGLPYSETPQLLKDGVRCDDGNNCNISYSGTTLTANVSSFSNYTTSAVTAAAAAASASSSSGSGGGASGWGICGDTVCNDGETCAAVGTNGNYGPCNLDCGVCPIGESSGESPGSPTSGATTDTAEKAIPSEELGGEPLTGQAFLTNIKEILFDYSYLWMALVALIVVIIGGVYLGKTVLIPRFKKHHLLKKTKSLQKTVVSKKRSNKKSFAPHVVRAHEKALAELFFFIVTIIVLYYLITGYWTEILSLGLWLIPIGVGLLGMIVIVALAVSKNRKAIIVNPLKKR